MARKTTKRTTRSATPIEGSPRALRERAKTAVKSAPVSTSKGKTSRKKAALLEAKTEKAAVICGELAKLYPDAKCSLDYQNPLQLLIATILSAQCTDERVNKVTPALFARYPTAESLAVAPQAEVEKLIQSTGFFRNKAKSIRGACAKIVADHDGEVPRTMEELLELPGVARKTANVVLGNAYGVPGLPVDTHVGRLSRRMGLSEHENPVKVEADLMSLLPAKEWTMFSHRMIYHGRQVCMARSPRCPSCDIQQLCPKLGVLG